MIIETLATVVLCAAFGLVGAVVFTAFENRLPREPTVIVPNSEPNSVPVQPTPGQWEQPPASNKACPVCSKSRDPIKHLGKVDHYHTTE